MPTANFETTFASERRFTRLIGLLGDYTDVLPFRLWGYAGNQHPEDGKLSDYTVAEIENIIGWKGKPGAAVDAMIEVGFLARDGVGYAICGWLEKQGHIAAFRERSRTASEIRWEREREKTRKAKEKMEKRKARALADAQAMLQASSKHSPILSCLGLSCGGTQDSLHPMLFKVFSADDEKNRERLKDQKYAERNKQARGLVIELRGHYTKEAPEKWRAALDDFQTGRFPIKETREAVDTLRRDEPEWFKLDRLGQIVTNVVSGKCAVRMQEHDNERALLEEYRRRQTNALKIGQHSAGAA